MSREITLTVLETPVTRRTLMAGGAKLAYSAPIIAASFHLTELRTRAEGIVSGPDEENNRGMFPPKIASIAYSAPGWILISGRQLSDAEVTFETKNGVVEVRSDETNKGKIEVNTDDQITISLTEEFTILKTTVETPDGIDIYKKKVKPQDKDKEKDKPDKNKPDEQKAEPEEAPRAEEQKPAPTEEAPVDDVPSEEQPVQNEPPADQPPEEPPTAEVPTQEPPTEEPTVVEEPVETPTVEEPPAVEPPAQKEPSSAKKPTGG
jgi:hypothetical protein